MLKFVISRYFIYAFMAIEIVLMPYLIDKSSYASIEYIKSISNILPFCLMGVYSGYMYEKYTTGKDYFKEALLIGLVLLFITGIIASIYFRNYVYIFSTVSVGCSILFEKRLQVVKDFNKAILYKPLLSVVIIIITAILLRLKVFSINHTLSLAYISAIVTWYFLIRKKIAIKIKPGSLKFAITKFRKMVKNGFLLNLGTVFYSLFIFSDRYFIKNFYNELLPSYSLAFNFAQMAIIGLTSINFITSVTLGENHREITLDRIKGLFSKSVLFLVGLIFLGALGAAFYTKYIRDFDKLIVLFIYIATYNGLFFAFGTISSLIFYQGNQKVLTIAFIILTFINYGSSFVVKLIHLSWHYLLIKSLILMMVYIVFGLYTIKKSFKRRGEMIISDK